MRTNIQPPALASLLEGCSMLVWWRLSSPSGWNYGCTWKSARPTTRFIASVWMKCAFHACWFHYTQGGRLGMGGGGGSAWLLFWLLGSSCMMAGKEGDGFAAPVEVSRICYLFRRHQIFVRYQCWLSLTCPPQFVLQLIVGCVCAMCGGHDCACCQWACRWLVTLGRDWCWWGCSSALLVIHILILALLRHIFCCAAHYNWDITLDNL